MMALRWRATPRPLRYMLSASASARFTCGRYKCQFGHSSKGLAQESNSR
jgi:hypothetical protein